VYPSGEKISQSTSEKVPITVEPEHEGGVVQEPSGSVHCLILEEPTQTQTCFAVAPHEETMWLRLATGPLLQAMAARWARPPAWLRRDPMLSETVSGNNVLVLILRGPHFLGVGEGKGQAICATSTVGVRYCLPGYIH